MPYQTLTGTELPIGYEEIRYVDLQKNKKTAFAVNLLSVALLLIVLFVGLPLRPMLLDDLFDHPLRLLMVIPGLALYLVLILRIQMAIIRRLTGQQAQIVLTSLYCSAACPDVYYDRRTYLQICWIPVAVIGVILLLLTWVLPPAWFWTIHILQAVNLCNGANVYLTVLLLRSPADALIQDYGVTMRVYSANH